MGAVCYAVRETDAELTEYAVILYEDTAHLADTVKHFLAFWVGTVTTPSLFSQPQST
jgi:uncharacterized protein (DUF427 family)